jgi:hypothetical protein
MVTVASLVRDIEAEAGQDTGGEGRRERPAVYGWRGGRLSAPK